MKGNNDLHLNEATMIEALQMYLDRLMPNRAPEVKHISKKDNAQFVVSVSEKTNVTP